MNAPTSSLSPEDRETVRTRLRAQKTRIEEAVLRSGRSATEVRLLAVSKRMPIELIEAAYEEGQRDFGENYAQELAQKATALQHLPEIRWHMIGHLQSNKAKLIAPFVHNVSSVDSVKLAAELSKQAVAHRPAERGDIQILVEVNIGREAQKGGAIPELVPDVLRAVQDSPRLSLAGLLCIPPDAAEAEDSRRYFHELAELRETWGGSKLLPELSMGMSRDLEVAVSEGATWVRIGTAIFGERLG
jgi:PLP dependent protein